MKRIDLWLMLTDVDPSIKKLAKTTKFERLTEIIFFIQQTKKTNEYF